MAGAPAFFLHKGVAEQVHLSSVCEELDKAAPITLAEDYDNVGLLLGDPDSDITRIALALEATDKTVDKAIAKGANLLVTHHPFLFKAIKTIDLSSVHGRLIAKAVKNNLAIYAAHTNFDAVDGGMNDALCSILNLHKTRPVLPQKGEKPYKLVTFVPDSHVDSVSQAIFNAGGGQIGNYSGCSFRGPGLGSFFPESGANPFSGKVGTLSIEPEFRLEVLVPKKNLSRAIAQMIKAHPYEEVAYDIYPLKEQGSRHGHGRIAELAKPVRLDRFAQQVKKALKLKTLRLTGKTSHKISKVAVCTGSGAFMIPVVSDPVKTCLVTGDIKYHDARLAEERGLSVIDAGHFGTEILFIQTMKRILTNRINDPSTGKPIDVVSLAGEKDPFVVVS